MVAVCLSALLCAPGRSRASDLADAVQRRDQTAVRELLARSVDVNAPQADGATALAWAVHWDNLELTRRLIEAGADVNLATELGVTPLMLASTNGSAVVAEALITAGADPSVVRASGDTALMLAARTGSVALVGVLLEHGAQINAATSNGQTALMWAAVERHLTVTRLLIAHGADIVARTKVDERAGRPGGIVREVIVLSEREAVNPAELPRDGDQDPPRAEGGFTPLLYAVLAGHADGVEALLDAGADVNDRAPDGVTALMLALTKRHEAIALDLLRRGADPSPVEAGYGALHVASATGQLRAAREILAHGADPNARMARPQRLTNAFEIGVLQSPGSGRLTQIGSTPFITAAKVADSAMMRLLAEAGGDPARTTDDGTTAAMMAAGLGKRAAQEITYYQWSETKAMAALGVALELGVDVNAANEHGETALHAAAYHNANDVIRFLVAEGASMDATNSARQTPLRIAEGHLICCTTFVRHEGAADVLRQLGADPGAGVQLTFGLTGYGDQPSR
jgi:ankyrin repeat protein